MRQRALVLPVAGLMVAGVLLAGCSASSSSAPAGGAAGVLNVGVIAPLSGSIPAVGTSTKNAAQMAMDDVNANGGIALANGQKVTVKINVQDDANDPKQAAAVAHTLIDQNHVNAIIGPQTSANAAAVAPIAQSSQTLMISPWAANPQVAQGRSFVFLVYLPSPDEGKVMAHVAVDMLHARTVAVLYDVSSDYPKTIAESFRDQVTALGAKVVSFQTYSQGQTDYTSQLTNIKQANPDVLFLPAYYNEVPLQVSQAQKLGITAKVIGSGGWDSPQILQLAGSSIEGDYFDDDYVPYRNDPKTQDFVKRYQAKYGSVPDSAAADTYDSFSLLFQAVAAANSTDSVKVQAAMANIRDFNGVSGHIAYKAGSGVPSKSGVIIQIQNGKFVYVATVNPE